MSEEKEKMQLGEREATSLYYMEQLLSGDKQELSVNGDEELNTIKLSYIEFAKHNLKDIIRLTKFLEKLETKFFSAVDEVLENEPQNIMLMTTAMDAISKLIANSQNVIRDVLKDERLQNIVINTTNYISADGGSATVIDPDSRDEIRNLAASILAQLEGITDEEESQDIIDVDGVEDV
jgi:hypothetical protein